MTEISTMLACAFAYHQFSSIWLLFFCCCCCWWWWCFLLDFSCSSLVRPTGIFQCAFNVFLVCLQHVCVTLHRRQLSFRRSVARDLGSTHVAQEPHYTTYLPENYPARFHCSEIFKPDGDRPKLADRQTFFIYLFCVLIYQLPVDFLYPLPTPRFSTHGPLPFSQTPFLTQSLTLSATSRKIKWCNSSLCGEIYSTEFRSY